MTGSVTVRPARDWDEVRRGAEVASEAFPNRTPDEPFFFERTLSAPMLPLENTRLVLVDGEVAGQLQVYERRVTIGGRAAWAGALGNVCTRPEYRGEGLGRRLVDDTVAFLREKDYALSLLLTGDRLRSFYRASGWVDLPRARHRLTLPADGGDGSAFAAFDADAHLDDVARIHRTVARDRDGAVRRTRSDWTEWVLDPDAAVGSSEDELAVYRADGSVTGYLAWGPRDGTTTCLELGHDGEDDEAFFGSVVDFLAARADGREVGWYPPVLDGLSDVRDVTVTTETSLGAMVQAHATDELSALAGERLDTSGALSDRLAPLHWSPLDAF